MATYVVAIQLFLHPLINQHPLAGIPSLHLTTRKGLSSAQAREATSVPGGQLPLGQDASCFIQQKLMMGSGGWRLLRRDSGGLLLPCNKWRDSGKM